MELADLGAIQDALNARRAGLEMEELAFLRRKPLLAWSAQSRKSGHIYQCDPASTLAFFLMTACRKNRGSDTLEAAIGSLRGAPALCSYKIIYSA